MTMSDFFTKNKVFILGLLGSIAVVLQQFLGTPTVDYKVMAFAIGAAITSYFAKNLHGQWASIAAICGTLVATFATTASGQHIEWLQIILQSIIGIIGVFTGPAVIVAKASIAAKRMKH